MSRLNVTTGDLQILTRLANELREIPFGERDRAVRHLLAELSALVGATNAYWVPAVRLRDEQSGLLGVWRVPSFELLEATEALLKDGAEAAARLAAGDPDRMTARYAAMAGHDRAARPVDLMSRIEWEEDWYVRDHLSRHRISDQVQSTSVVHRRAEVTFGFWREGRSRFGKRERDVLLLAGTVLREPLRNLIVAEGWLGPDGKLTRREREVLDRLLRGMTEREIAEDLGSAVNTVHHQAASVYGKLGVHGRTGLLALWAGIGTPASSAPDEGTASPAGAVGDARSVTAPHPRGGPPRSQRAKPPAPH